MSFLMIFFGYLLIIVNTILAGTLNLMLSTLCSVAAICFLYSMQYPGVRNIEMDLEQVINAATNWRIYRVKNQLIKLLCLLIPSFAFVYFLAMAKLIGPDESLIAFIACSAATKAFYAIMLMNSHTDAIKHIYVSQSSANAARGTFLRYVMHEVRVPLKSVATGIGVMSSYNLSDEARDTLSLIKSETDNISDILNNILSIKEIDNGKFELKYSLFNIYDVLRHVSTSIHDGWCHKNIQVDVSVDDNIPVQMSGDSSRIEHVLLCLLNSAASLAPSSSSIKISVSRINRSDTKCIELRFEIAYKGPGLTAETLTLFEPYSQLSPHHIPREDNIGLYVCNKIIALHGGRLQASSDVDRGNTFMFNIVCLFPQACCEIKTICSNGRVQDFNDKLVLSCAGKNSIFTAIAPQDKFTFRWRNSLSAKTSLKHASIVPSIQRASAPVVINFPAENFVKKKALIVDG